MSVAGAVLALLFIGIVVLTPTSHLVAEYLKRNGEKFIPTLLKTTVVALAIVAIVYVGFIAIQLEYVFWAPLVCIGAALITPLGVSYLKFRR